MMEDVVREGTGTAGRAVEHRHHRGRQDRHGRDRRPEPQPGLVHRLRAGPGPGGRHRRRDRGHLRAPAAWWPRRSPPRSCAPRSAPGSPGELRARRADRRPLRARAPARQRRHGAGLPRPRPPAGPPGGDQGALGALRVGPAVRGALPPRGLARGRAQPPEHRGRLRPRRGGRQLLHRHGVPGGARPQAGHPLARAAARRSRPSTTRSRSWRPSARRTAATSSTAT